MQYNLTKKIFKSYHIRLSLLAIVTGFLAGIGAVCVRATIKYVQLFSYNNVANLIEGAKGLPVYLRILVPCIGGLIVGLLIYFFAKEAKGHGVPEVMDSVLSAEGKIRKRVAFIKALASSICIGTGGSVGREGPLVQIGSSVGSTIGQFFHQDTKAIRTLVAAGAAGGIAAAFNAPFAGCLFAVEIILGNFAVASFSPIVISSVTATIVSHHFEGNFPVFMIPIKYALKSPFELIPYAFLGLIAGISALVFIKILYKFEDILEGWKFPEYLKPMIGGGIIGLIGLKVPEILGVGYETIHQALLGKLVSIKFILFLILIKILSTSLTLGSGGSGGVFAPSLFLGALLGNAVGLAAKYIFPHHLIANPGAYSLVGMGAVVAGATHAPITAIIIIFELTKDYEIILPLMFACIISSLLTSSLKQGSIYTEKLLRRGILFKEGQEDVILKKIPLFKYIVTDFLKIHPKEKISRILDKVLESKQEVFPVVDDNDALLGIITFQEMKMLLYEKDDIENIIVIEDIMEKPVHLNSNLSLWDAIKVFSHYKADELPVVKDNKVIGIISEQIILEVYNKEVQKRNIALTLLNKRKFTTNLIHGYELGGGFYLKEITIPENFENKTLKELNIRYDFDLEIVMVYNQKLNKNIIPTGNTILEKGDAVLVIGTKEQIEKFENSFIKIS